MKKLIVCFLICCSVSMSFAQEWMTNLDVAKRLALVQDKFLVAVWENSYYDGIPVYLNTGKGSSTLVKNMFNEPVLDSVLWDHFIPVIIKENAYPEMYEEIKNKRSTAYIDKFHDESLKIMDANGNILNSSGDDNIINLTNFIYKYNMSPAFFNKELINYKNKKNFYSTFYLASKYMDYAFFAKESVREEFVNLGSIYLEESSEILEKDNKKNKIALEQRVYLLEIQKDLILQRPKRVIRKLKKIKDAEVEQVNKNLYDFLYYSSFVMIGDKEEASAWEADISVFDLKKLSAFINTNPE